jgi:hypothetical protein
MNREIQVGILVVMSVMWKCPLHGQEIHIRVLNAHNGKPITNECVNVWFGPPHGAGLIAPTNKHGVVVLHLARNEVTADSVFASSCDRIAVLGPKPLPKDGDTIAITSDDYVDCQEWAKVIPGATPKENLSRAPSYPIKNILETGVVASNTCGKFKAEARPGDLIFFVRPASWWEKMRR